MWSEQEKCSRGYVFDPNDNNLVLETETILVYNNLGEQVFRVRNYEGRSTHRYKERVKFGTFYLINKKNG